MLIENQAIIKKSLIQSINNLIQKLLKNISTNGTIKQQIQSINQS